jgi:hypothetical protein
VQLDRTREPIHTSSKLLFAGGCLSLFPPSGRVHGRGRTFRCVAAGRTKFGAGKPPQYQHDRSREQTSLQDPRRLLWSRNARVCPDPNQLAESLASAWRVLVHTPYACFGWPRSDRIHLQERVRGASMIVLEENLIRAWRNKFILQNDTVVRLAVWLRIRSSNQPTRGNFGDFMGP